MLLHRIGFAFLGLCHARVGLAFDAYRARLGAVREGMIKYHEAAVSDVTAFVAQRYLSLTGGVKLIVTAVCVCMPNRFFILGLHDRGNFLFLLLDSSFELRNRLLNCFNDDIFCLLVCPDEFPIVEAGVERGSFRLFVARLIYSTAAGIFLGICFVVDPMGKACSQDVF